MNPSTNINFENCTDISKHSARERRHYFFFDIDGTLVPESGGKEVPKSARDAIARLEEKGHFCAIATGRSHCLAEPQRKAFGFSNMISDGGNSVVIDGKLLGIQPLDREACIDLIKECEQLNFPWAVSIEDTPLRLTKYEAFKERADNAYQSSTVVPNLDIDAIPQVLKMFVAIDPGEEEKLHTLTSGRLPWVRHRKQFLYVEAMHKEVGIQAVMKHFHALDEDIVVFGDGKNDLSMFLPQWTCIAMGNAVPELKERATFITKDAKDDGIAYALKHFGWIE